MKQEIQSINQVNNHQAYHQSSVFDAPQQASSLSNNTILTPNCHNQKVNTQNQSFNIVAAQTTTNYNNNGTQIQPSFGALSLAGQELTTGQIAISSYTQDIKLLKEKSGVKIGLVNKNSQFLNANINNNDNYFAQEKNVQNQRILQQPSGLQNASIQLQNKGFQNQNNGNLLKNSSFPGQSQNKLIDASRLQIAATLSQQQPVGRVLDLQAFQQQQNMNEITNLSHNMNQYSQNLQSSQCSNSTQLAITHYHQNQIPQELQNAENQFNNLNHFQNSQVSSTHTYQYNMPNNPNTFSQASQNNKENFDYKNVSNNLVQKNNNILYQQLQNNSNENKNKVFQIVNSQQYLNSHQQKEINKVHPILQKQNSQNKNNSNSRMSSYSNTRGAISNNQTHLNDNHTSRLLQVTSLNEVRQKSNGIIQAGTQALQMSSTVNINSQIEQTQDVFKVALNQQKSGNILNPFQQNALKMKQIPLSQNSTSINLPRGTNPKRSFGRDSNQFQQNSQQSNQNFGSQNSNVFQGSILMKGSQNKQIEQAGVNRFSIHPILQGGHNQIVGLGTSSNGIQTTLSSVQQQARIKNLVDQPKMVIVENNIKQQKSSEGYNESCGKKSSFDQAGQNSQGSLRQKQMLQKHPFQYQSSQINQLNSKQSKEFQNTTQMPQIIFPQSNLHQHSTSTQHQTIIQQQLISAPLIIGNTSKTQGQNSNQAPSLIATINPSRQYVNDNKFQKQNSSDFSAMSGIEVKNTNESNSQGPPGINKSGKYPLNQKNNQNLIGGNSDSSVKQNKSLILINLGDQKSQNQLKAQKHIIVSNKLGDQQNKRKSDLKSQAQGNSKNKSVLGSQNQYSNNKLPSTIIQSSNDNQKGNDKSNNENLTQENFTQQMKQLRPSQTSGGNFQHQTHRIFGQIKYSVMAQNQQNQMQYQQNQENKESMPFAKQKRQSIDKSQTNKNNKGVFNNQQMEKIKSNQNFQDVQMNNNHITKKYLTSNTTTLLKISQNEIHTAQQEFQQKDQVLQSSQMQTTQALNQLGKKRIGSHIPILLQQNNQTIQHARNKSHNTSNQNTTKGSPQKDQQFMMKKLIARANTGLDSCKTSNYYKEYQSVCYQQSPHFFEKKLNQVNQDFNQRVGMHMKSAIEECDLQNAANPQSVCEYTKNIMQHYMKTEMNNQPKIKYMELQQCINERMRSILIDWIIEVHFQFKLKTESLFLTVNLIDRYLEKAAVSKENLQLVGVSAMLIACKYEEIWPPLIKDYIYMCDNAYDKEQIINQEMSMLTELDFNVDFVSANTFLERFIQITKQDQITHHLAQYIIEISMLDYSSIHIQPSYMAISALYLAQKIIKNPNPFSKQLQIITQYTEKSIDNLSQVLFRLLKNYQKPNQLMGLKKKFSSEQFSCISQQIQFDHSSQTKNQQAEEDGGISNNKSSSRGKSNVKTQASCMNGASTSEGKRTISAEKMGHFTTQKSVGSTQHGTSNKKIITFQFNQKHNINTPAIIENQQNKQHFQNHVDQSDQQLQTTQDSTNIGASKHGQMYGNFQNKHPNVSQFMQNNNQQNSSNKNNSIQNRQILEQQKFQNIQNQIEAQKMLLQENLKYQSEQQQILLAQMQNKNRNPIEKLIMQKQNQGEQYSSSSNQDYEENKSSFSSENTYSSGQCEGNQEQQSQSVRTNTLDQEMN